MSEPSSPPRKRGPLPDISVVVKAYNEEAKIERTLLSVLAATAPLNAEVILADSLSTDHTVEVARHLPVRVVQLRDAHERSCGVGAQLGYEYSVGQWVFVMDGDMELCPDFLETAIRMMESDTKLAGVGGQIEEMNAPANLEFKARHQRNAQRVLDGEEPCLNGGGLYRRQALEEVGYLTDRNLHSLEELELGLRLRAAGWTLRRIPMVAVRHYGHTVPTLRLMADWWTGKVKGPGELIRASFGRPYLGRALGEAWLYLGVISGWGIVLGLPGETRTAQGRVAAGCAGLTVVLGVMTVRKGSLAGALYSVSLWHYLAAGLVRGLFSRRIDPTSPISSTVVHEPAGLGYQPPGTWLG